MSRLQRLLILGLVAFVGLQPFSMVAHAQPGEQTLIQYNTPVIVTLPPGQTVLIRAKTPRGPNGCISGDEAMLRARKYEAGYIRPPNTLNNPAWHLGEPLQREKGQCEGTACAQVEILKGPNDDCVHVQNIGKTPVRVSVTRYGQFDSELRGFDVLIPPGHLRKMPAPGGCYLATGGRPVPPKLGNTRYIANYPLPEAKTGGPRPAPPFYFPGR